MKKVYSIKCKKYRKLKNPEISYFFYKTLVLSIICGKCGSKSKRILKEQESMEILTILGLIKNFIITLKISRKRMQGLTLDLKKIDETKAIF